MWSLSVEEQFYLVWPLVLLLFSRRGMLLTCGAILLIEAIARSMLPTGNDEMFTLTPIHLDGLAVGAALALVLREPGLLSNLRSSWARVVALLPIAAAVFLRSGRTPDSAAPQDFFLIALACGSIMFLTLTAGSTDVLPRVLTLAWLRSIGQYSYAIYLFHQIVGQVMSQLVRHIQPPTLFGPALPAAAVIWLTAGFTTFGFAWLSWQFFEQRILSLKRYFPVSTSVVQSTPVAARTLLGVADV